MKPPKIGARQTRREGRVAQSAMLACLLLIGCHRASDAAGSELEYGFIHHETTGVTSAIAVGAPSSRTSAQDAGRTEETIMFSTDSNPDAIESLYSLDPRLFLPNANGEGIVVVGVLDSTVRHTPSAPDMAASEPYREFRLSRWYLRAPFVRWRNEPLPNVDPGVERDTKLRPEDFDGRVQGDLSRFVRLR